MSKDITATDIKALMIQSYRRFANGEISESKAMKENSMLANILKAIEASETEKRLRAIEDTLSINHEETNYDYE